MTERAPRRGRPPGTSSRELELIALRLFAEQGFDETTIEQIAVQASINKRTFFRYFESKASVLWRSFDEEIELVRRELARVAPEVAMMDAIRVAVVAANHYRAEDVPELRLRMNLIGSSAGLAIGSVSHYEAWERVVREFVAGRIGQSPDSLFPMAVARASLATVRAAYDRWVARADADLTVYLDAALTALGARFAGPSITAEPRSRRRSRAS